MTKSCNVIIFGSVNKKFLLPFFLAVSEIIYIIFNKYYPVQEDNMILLISSMALAEMSIKLIPFVLKIHSKEEKKEKEQLITKKKFIHYTILTSLYLVNTIIIAGAEVFDFYIIGVDNKSYSGSNLFPDNDLILMSIEMVFLILVSIWLLKYKYYKHHIISTIIFIIFGITSELCLETYFTSNGKFFLGKLIRLIGAAVDATYYCYQKYMMEKYYYPYWNIAFVPGLIMFIIAAVLFIAVLALPNSKQPFIASFYLYFKVKQGLGLAILKVVIAFVIHLFMCPLAILNIFYFPPNFILIIFQFSRITKNIINNSSKKLYCLVFYAIQLFALMIHLEILELNFCGLNKYTKRNISLRGIDDFLLEKYEPETCTTYRIDIDRGYSIDSLDGDKVFEMKEQVEENEEKEDEREGEQERETRN